MTRSLLALLALVGLVPGSLAQSADDFGKLNIAVVMPDEQRGFEADQLEKFQTRLLTMLNQHGIASQGIDNGIALYPILQIYNEQQINPGMGLMTALDVDVSLFIKQLDDKFIFSSLTRKLRGSGRTREQAMNNLIAGLKDDDEFAGFVSKAKDKIIGYYEKKCPSIQSQADQLARVNQHDRALSMLLGIPPEVSCFEKSKAKLFEVYRSYQARVCGTLVSKGRALLESNQWAEGFEILSKVDPTSPCAKEVNALYAKHGAEVDQDTKRRWDFLNKMWTNTFELEKYRLKAISDLSVAYTLSHPRPYAVIVR